MFRLKVLKVNIHIINISNCTFDAPVLADFMDFQNETACLCVNNSINTRSELLWYHDLI